MKRIYSAGMIIYSVLVAGAVCMGKSHSRPETVLTEPILAERDHQKVPRAIREMCADKSFATTPVGAVLSVRAPLGSDEELRYPAFSQKPIAPFDSLAAIMIGLKPLLEKSDSFKLLNTSVARLPSSFLGPLECYRASALSASLARR